MPAFLPLLFLVGLAVGVVVGVVPGEVVGAVVGVVVLGEVVGVVLGVVVGVVLPLPPEHIAVLFKGTEFLMQSGQPVIAPPPSGALRPITRGLLPSASTTSKSNGVRESNGRGVDNPTEAQVTFRNESLAAVKAIFPPSESSIPYFFRALKMTCAAVENPEMLTEDFNLHLEP